MENQKRSQSKTAPKGSLMDIELSIRRNDITLIIQYGSRSHKVTISSKDARELSNQLAKAADFLEKPDVIS